MVSHFSDQWWIETNQEPGCGGERSLLSLEMLDMVPVLLVAWIKLRMTKIHYIYIYSDTLKLRMRFWKRHAAKKTLHNAKKWGAALFLPRFFSRGILVMEILECVPTELFII